MTRCINKDALIADITSLKVKHDCGWNCAIDKVLEHIDDIETKEVDLEEEICSFFSKNPIPYEHITDWPLLKNCAIHFFELGLKAQKGE